MHFKSEGKWYPIHVKHFSFYYMKLDRIEIKILGKVYTERSEELEKALEQERLWNTLND